MCFGCENQCLGTMQTWVKISYQSKHGGWIGGCQNCANQIFSGVVQCIRHPILGIVGMCQYGGLLFSSLPRAATSFWTSIYPPLFPTPATPENSLHFVSLLLQCSKIFNSYWCSHLHSLFSWICVSALWLKAFLFISCPQWVSDCGLPL